MGNVRHRETTQMGYQEYRVITLNVNGLHNPIKRSRVISKMKREKVQIIFWQETHLSDAEHDKLKKDGLCEHILFFS